MPAAGLEPARGHPQQILSLPRLPFRQAGISRFIQEPKYIVTHENIICKDYLMIPGEKHEKVAIFRRKMCGFRMFLGFRERETRRNP